MDSFCCAGVSAQLLLVAGAAFALGGSRGEDSLEEARRPAGLVGAKPDPVFSDGPNFTGNGSGDPCGMDTGYSAAQVVSTEVKSPAMQLTHIRTASGSDRV